MTILTLNQLGVEFKLQIKTQSIHIKNSFYFQIKILSNIIIINRMDENNKVIEQMLK